MTASAGDREHPLVRLWWVFPSVLAIAVTGLALANRERPLDASQLPEPLVASMRPLAGDASQSPPWSEVRMVGSRTVNSSYAGSAEVLVETRIERLDASGLVRRTDDWKQIAGQGALFEERGLIWKGLLGLVRTERTPAPLYHAIFANEGWLALRTLSVKATRDPEFPSKEGSALKADIERVREEHPPRASTLARRRTECRRNGSFDAGEVFDAWTESLPRVTCDSEEKRGDGPTLYFHTDYVYLASHDLYIAVAWTDDEPLSPIAGDNGPAARVSGRMRITRFDVS